MMAVLKYDNHGEQNHSASLITRNAPNLPKTAPNLPSGINELIINKLKEGKKDKKYFLKAAQETGQFFVWVEMIAYI